MVDYKLVAILELLKEVPEVDSMMVNANTKYEMEILWNPNMNGGEFQCVTKDSRYEDYVSCKSATDVAKFLRIMDWMPDDWDNADECAEEIIDASGDYEWYELTDEIICNIAKMVGICE